MNYADKDIVTRELLTYCDGSPLIIVRDEEKAYDAVLKLIAYVKTVENPEKPFVNAVSLSMRMDNKEQKLVPTVRTDSCRLFHPNFTDDGLWCCAEFEPNETVSSYLERLVRNLQFKHIDDNRIGNRNAMAWYHRKKNSGLFPTDPINYHFKPQINILHINTYDQEEV